MDVVSDVNPEMPVVGGRLKFLRDAVTILELRLFAMKQAIHWHLLGSLVFPVSMFFLQEG